MLSREDYAKEVEQNAKDLFSGKITYEEFEKFRMENSDPLIVDGKDTGWRQGKDVNKDS